MMHSKKIFPPITETAERTGEKLYQESHAAIKANEVFNNLIIEFFATSNTTVLANIRKSIDKSRKATQKS